MFGSRTKSFSNFEETAKKTYRWRSSEQNFVCWNPETQEQELLDKAPKFIPLTATSSVNGAREQDHGKATCRWNRIYSNEFTDFKNDYIKVRESDKLDGTKTVLCEGVYNPTVKEFVASNSWAKYTTNVYCLLDGEVVKLELFGAALTAWIEFQNKCKSEKAFLFDHHYFTFNKAEQRKNGAVTFYAPSFELGDITDEEDDKATEVAKEIEAKIEHNKALSAPDAATDVTAAAAAKAEEDREEETSDGAVDLSEIPF